MEKCEACKEADRFEIIKEADSSDRTERLVAGIMRLHLINHHCTCEEEVK